VQGSLGGSQKDQHFNPLDLYGSASHQFIYGAFPEIDIVNGNSENGVSVTWY